MTGLDSPRPTPKGVPKVEDNAACPGYNQQLKVSTTGETVRNKWCNAANYTELYTVTYHTTYGGHLEHVKKVRTGF